MVMRFRGCLRAVPLLALALLLAVPFVSMNTAVAYPIPWTATFYETGLGSGVQWFVTLGSHTIYTTGTSISFSGLTSGISYSYDYASSILSGGKTYSCETTNCDGTVSVSASSVTATYYVVSSSFSVTFSESGLPSGAQWFVTVGSNTQYSTSSSITFNGLTVASSYVYASSVSSGGNIYSCATASCSGTVTSGTPSISATYNLVQSNWSATLSESGLPSGAQWFVTVGSNTKYSTSSSITFTGLSGPSYSFTYGTQVQSGSDLYLCSTNCNGILYKSSPSETATYTKLAQTFTATFTETGISLNSWTVTVDGTPHTVAAGSKVTVSGLSLVSHNYQYQSPDGVYICSQSCSGSVTPSSNTVNAVYISQFTVVFQAFGLPSGTSWTVTVGGSPHTGTCCSQISFLVTPGWSWMFQPVTAGGITYTCTGCHGSFGVSSPTYVTGTYQAAQGQTYSTTFYETGLPTDTQLTWQVTVGGVVKTVGTGGSQVTVSGLSGTVAYTYQATVTDPPTGDTYTCGPNPDQCSGSVTSSVNAVHVKYTKSSGDGGGDGNGDGNGSVYNYTAGFEESGLPYAVSWTVTLSGQIYSGGTVTTVSNVPHTTDKSAQTVDNLVGSQTYSFDAQEVVTGVTYLCSPNPDPCSGTFDGSDGHLVDLKVMYSEAVSSYNVTFREVGLPSNSTWHVTVAGSQYTTSSNSLNVTGLSGTQGYVYQSPVSAGGVSYYCTVSCSGVVTSATPVITATYVLPYDVTFMQTGIPSGVTWGVTFNGTTSVTAGSNITFHSLLGPAPYTYVTPVLGTSGTQYVCSSRCIGTVSNSTTITATYYTQYYLTTRVTPSGTGTVNPISEWVTAGSSVTVAATPITNYIFIGWAGSGSGSYTGTSNPATVKMNGPITETATFVYYLVSVQVTASNLNEPLLRGISGPQTGFVTVDGVDITTPRMFTWHYGTTHTIAAYTTISCGYGCQWVFKSWSDRGEPAHVINATLTQVYMANFAHQYYVTVQATVGGTTSPASGWQNATSRITLTATPYQGFVFQNWMGIGPGSYTGLSNPAVLPVNGAINETATFAQGSNTGTNSTVTPSSLMQKIQSYYLQGAITDPNLEKSLYQKIAVVQQLLSGPQTPANLRFARQILQAFIGQVQAQRGRWISTTAADDMTGDASTILNSIPPI